MYAAGGAAATVKKAVFEVSIRFYRSAGVRERGVAYEKWRSFDRHPLEHPERLELLEVFLV